MWDACRKLLTENDHPVPPPEDTALHEDYDAYVSELSEERFVCL